MKRGKTLTDVLTPWLEGLSLPGGPLRTWVPEEFALRGTSHWYTYARKKPNNLEYDDWVLTVRGKSVEVRDDNSNNGGRTVIGWVIIEAADPNFFTKLEAAIRAAVDYLMRS